MRTIVEIDDGTRYEVDGAGDRTVRFACPTPGAHTATITTQDDTGAVVATRTRAFTTTAAPESSWVLTDTNAPLAGQYHQGQIGQVPIEDDRVKMCALAQQATTFGVVYITPDRSNPLHKFASDIDPDWTMSVQEICAHAATPLANEGNRALYHSLWFDQPGRSYLFEHGAVDGYYDWLKLGRETRSSDGETVNGSVYALEGRRSAGNPSTETYHYRAIMLDGMGATDPSITFSVDPAGGGGDRGWGITVSRKWDDATQKWVLNDPDLPGVVWSGSETSKTHYMTGQEAGNRSKDWSSTKIKVLTVWAIDNFWLSNMRFVPPGGADDGDIAVRAFSGLDFRYCDNIVLQNIEIRGFSKGWGGHPPGETFQLMFNRCKRIRMTNFVIDGRRPDGARVAASPLGFNWGDLDAVFENGRIIGGRASMLTNWRGNGRVTFRHVNIEDSSGPGVNSEDGCVTPGSEMRFEWCTFDVRSGYNNNPTSTSPTQHATITSGNAAAEAGTFASYVTFVNCKWLSRGAYDYQKAGGDLGIVPVPAIAPTAPPRGEWGFTPTFGISMGYEGRLANGATDGRNSLDQRKDWGIKMWGPNGWEEGVSDREGRRAFDATERPIYDPSVGWTPTPDISQKGFLGIE